MATKEEILDYCISQVKVWKDSLDKAKRELIRELSKIDARLAIIDNDTYMLAFGYIRIT